MQTLKAFLCCVVLISSVLCDLPSNPNAAVNAHNNVRQPPVLSPAASPPLPSVTWNPTVASFSSSYANNCIFQHSSGSGYGENLYITSDTSRGENAIADAVTAWNGEAPNYHIGPNTCDSGRVCGHYTQLVWNTTTSIGCGFKSCSNVAGFGPGTIVVCNYSPPGNWNGLRPYIASTGAPPTPTPSSTPPPSSSPSSSPPPSPSSSRSSTPPPSLSPTSSSSPPAPTSSSTPPPSLSPSSSPPPPPSPSPSSTPPPSHSPAPSSSPSPSSSPLPPPCENTCPAGSCGPQIICGASVNCGTCLFGEYCDGTCVACPDPCGPGQCGSLASAICPDYYIPCPACAFGEVCSNNECTIPPCDTEAACAEIGATCGTQSTSCGATNCGSCSAGNSCFNGECVANTCGGACTSSQVCDTESNSCVCAAGYSLVNGVCTAGSSGPPSWATDFTVISGSGAITTPGNIIAVSGSGETIIKYSRTHSYTVIDPAYTRVKVEALATTGQGFGIGLRVGQSTGATDGMYMKLHDIGTANMNLESSIIKNGGTIYSSGAWYLPTAFWSTNQANFVEAVLTTDGGMTTIAWTQTTVSGWQASNGLSATASYYAPATGSVAFWFNNPSGSPGMQRLAINTGSALTISLYECVDLAQWTTMFFQSTGLNPATSTLQIRDAGTNGACKGASTKEAASGFVLVVESSAVTASVITQAFVSAVESGSPAVAGLAVESVAVLPAAEAAAVAGLIPAGVVPAVVTPGGAAAGGGAAGGLSGGAIAGIVIGSVGGAILIVGVTAVIVAAVVVAAVVVAKKASDDESEGPSRSEPVSEKRGSIRNTIYNIFRAPRGGVDVMNNPDGHQSITARAPKV